MGANGLRAAWAACGVAASAALGAGAGCSRGGAEQGPAAANKPGRVRLVRAPGSPVAVGAPAARPGVGDVNGDGLLDLVAPCGPGAGREGARLRVLINRGGARMEAGQGFGAWKDAPDVLLGDLNGDGRLDLVAAEHDSDVVTVMLGDGKGGFAPAAGPLVRTGAKGKPHTHGMALADVNGDTRLDVLTTNADEGSVSVLLGDGKGGFDAAPGSPFVVGARTEPYEGIVVADLSGDGAVDVAVPLLRGDAVAIMLGDGRGGLGPARRVRVGARPGFLTTADVNGDRRPDLVVTTWGW